MKPWFEEREGRLERELEALREGGTPFEVDSEAKKQGVLRLHLEVTVQAQDTPLCLVATYPDLYPFFRPNVDAPGLEMDRHIHPFVKQLCLLAKPTEYWNPEDTLQDLLDSQLSETLEAGREASPDVVASREGEQAEPFSAYYAYEPNTSLLIDSGFEVGPASAFGARAGKMHVRFHADQNLRLRGAVAEIQSGSGEVLHALDERVTSLFSKEITGQWRWLDQPPSANKAAEILEIAGVPPYKKRRRRGREKIDGAGWIQGVTGVAFPEEIRPGEMGVGWIFVIEAKSQNADVGTRAYLVPAQRAGREDLRARVPETRLLQRKTISIAGLGCVGAPSALELARAGAGKLRLVDNDSVDADTTVRWPLGLPSSGVSKAQALCQFISRHYPYTNTEGLRWRIGETRPLQRRAQSSTSWEEAWEWFWKDTSLVYDAAAEEGVSHYLSQQARKREIPYVAIYGTQGGWGGVALRIDPKQTEGCWMCFRHFLMDGTIERPAEDESGMIQPLGCSDPTFTGAGFDMSNISLMGVRLAVSTLCGNEKDGYPKIEWDVGVLSLRDADGRPTTPNWKTNSLKRHPECPYCSGPGASSG